MPHILQNVFLNAETDPDTFNVLLIFNVSFKIDLWKCVSSVNEACQTVWKKKNYRSSCRVKNK